MAFDLKSKKYQKWLQENMRLSDPFAPDAMRSIIANLIMGKNYRLLTEQNTKGKLMVTYAWLIDLYKRAEKTYGQNWKESLLEDILGAKAPDEDKDTARNLGFWLLGLTYKTAHNLEISSEDLPEFLRESLEHCSRLFSKTGNARYLEQSWLLMMAGAATLNIRGAQKSKIGKGLERIFLRASLTMLGFKLNDNFWVNIERDLEVEREADAEVQTKRGRLRIDMGLIESGNQEVIEDKINRVGRNGIVIFDRLGPKSNVHETAKRNLVKLIQIRHNQPLVELKQYLQPLVNIKLNEIPEQESQIVEILKRLPDNLFTLAVSCSSNGDD